MMNLWDVPDMNVGDMVNGCTSLHNASYTTHVTDVFIPYKTRYYNFGTTGYYNFDTNCKGLLDSWVSVFMTL